MITFWHTIRFHRVLAGYYMGFKTNARRCRTCRAEWTVK